MNSIPMTGGGFLSERDSECVMEEYGEEEDTYTLGLGRGYLHTGVSFQREPESVPV